MSRGGGGNSLRIFPSEGKIVFDGGLNNKYPNSVIDISESPDCLNVAFADGAAGTRQGSSKLNSTSLGSFVIDGIYTRHQDSTAQTMVVFAGGSGYVWNSTTFATIGSAQSVFSLGVRIFGAEFQNNLYVGNGTVIPYKYTGSEFNRHGVYPPTTTMAVATAGTGSVLTGTFSWAVTFVNSQLVEGNASPVTSSITLTAKNGALTSIPVAPTSWGVASRRIYRKSSAAGFYQRVATISDNSTTSYDDGIADASLGATMPTDNGVPPLYSVCVYHKQRLFMNDPANLSLVSYTYIDSSAGPSPYTVNSLGFFRIGDGSGEVVRTIAPYGDSLLVGTDKGLWLVYMPDTTPANWQFIRLKSQYGSVSPYCFLQIKDRTLFASTENGVFRGFGEAQGDQVTQNATFLTVMTTGSDLVSDRIQPDMNLVQAAFLGNISGITYKNRAYIAVTYNTGATTNNRIYILDFSQSDLSKKQKESWAPWTGINASQFTIYNGSLYAGSSTANGFVYQLENGLYSDDGAAINSYLWTKEITGFDEDTSFYKDFRKAVLLIDLPGSYYMNVTYRVDSDAGVGATQQVSLDPSGNKWGTMVWGVDSWGGGKSQNEYTLDLGSLSGRRVQFMFSNQNTAGQRFKVHWANLRYNLKGQR